MPPQYRLPFEKEIYDLEDLLSRLEASNGQPDRSEEIRQLRKDLVALKRKIYSNLSAWETVLVSRHPERPQTLDYIDLMFEEFVELHGDRAFGDDRAMRCGFARLGDFRVMLLGHQKGHNTRAKPEIWSDYAGFEKAAANATAQAEKLVQLADANDKAGFATQFQALAQACGSCHRAFRDRGERQ